jgi:hypothetical protein
MWKRRGLKLCKALHAQLPTLGCECSVASRKLTIELSWRLSASASLSGQPPTLGCEIGECELNKVTG